MRTMLWIAVSDPCSACAAASAAVAAPAAQAGEPALGAYLSSGVAKLGDRVTLVVTVTNANDVRLGELPSVPGLALAGPQGPNSSVSETWLNGRRTRTVEHSYLVVIQPTATGEYTIPPIEVLVDGRRAPRPSCSLSVVEDLRRRGARTASRCAPPPRASSRASPSRSRSSSASTPPSTSASTTSNLSLPWWDQLPGALELETPEPPGGRLRVRAQLAPHRARRAHRRPRRCAAATSVTFRIVRSFLPTRTGTIAFPTSFVEFGEVEERRDFFRTERRKVETWYVRAPDLALEVVALPEEGRPLDFTGALGTHHRRGPGRAARRGRRRLDQARPSSGPATATSSSSSRRTSTGSRASRASASTAGPTSTRASSAAGVTYDLAPLSSEITEIPSRAALRLRSRARRVLRGRDAPAGDARAPARGRASASRPRARASASSATCATSRPARRAGGWPQAGRAAAGRVAPPSSASWRRLRCCGSACASSRAAAATRTRRSSAAAAARGAPWRARSRALPGRRRSSTRSTRSSPRARASPSRPGSGATRARRSGSRSTPTRRASSVELVRDLERGAFGGGPRVPAERVLGAAARLERGGL